MGHPQPARPTQIGHSNATGIVNRDENQQKSKVMGMHFYYVQDCVQQKHIVVYWCPGEQNLAEHFTKHFPAAHHQQIWPQYLHVAATTIIIAPFTSMPTHMPVTARVCSSSSGLPLEIPVLWPIIKQLNSHTSGFPSIEPSRN